MLYPLLAWSLVSGLVPGVDAAPRLDPPQRFLVTMASGIAGQLLPLDPASQHLAIQNLRKQSPELADLVIQFLTSMGGAQRQQQQQGGPGGPGAAGGMPGLGANGQAAVEINMKPLPEQRAPRRAATAV